jgi:sensor histidine kinase YesM
MDKTERRLCLYCAMLIAIMLNSTKLLALRENGILAHYWHFNLAEFLFQLLYSFGFTWLFLYINLYYNFWAPSQRRRYALNVLIFIALVFLGMMTGGVVQRNFFSDKLQQVNLFWSGYFSRFVVDGLLVGIVIKIILLLREGRQKSRENAELKNAYLEAELEILKGQLNPHFLFNSLSSLSAIIREDPQLAQHYVGQLSKVFRYSLQRSGANLVSVEDELNTARAYGQLLTMRFEKGFQLDVQVDESYNHAKIPHLSIQLLLENAAKHNLATVKKPLVVSVYAEGNELIVKNNLQEINNPEGGSGIGLANLNSRFRILTDKEIEIVKTAADFSVKLPLSFDK